MGQNSVKGKRYLKLKNAAKYVDMSEKSFKRYILNNVRHFRIGRCIYVDIADLDKYLQELSDAGAEDVNFYCKVDDVVKKLQGVKI